MAYPNFQLSEINLSELILVKEVIKKYGEQDGSRWIFRAPHWIDNDNASNVYIKVWNSTYFRHHHILSGIEAGFYDQSTTPALIGVITHRGYCRGYIQHPCGYHRKIEPEFHHLIRAKTLQTGLFFLQYSRYHIMRYKAQYSLIDLEGIYPIQQLPDIKDSHTVFEDLEYARFVLKLYRERYPDRRLQLSDLVASSTLQSSGYPPLNRVFQFPRQKVNAGLKLLKMRLMSRRGISKNRISLIEI